MTLAHQNTLGGSGARVPLGVISADGIPRVILGVFSVPRQRKVSLAAPKALVICAVAQRIFADGAELRAQAMVVRLIIRMATRPGAFVDALDVGDALWPDFARRPHDERRYISLLVTRARQAIEPFGMTIKSALWSGYRFVSFIPAKEQRWIQNRSNCKRLSKQPRGKKERDVFTAPDDIEAPSWVPQSLQDDYCELASDMGATYASAQIHHLLREMASA